MEWDKIYREHKEQKQAPQLELIEPCWQMRSLQKSTRILECGIYRTAAGLEVRTGYAPDHLLRSQVASDMVETARDIAEAWRQAVVEKGGFEELSLDNGGPH
jgi:hypothetical protein